MLESSANGHLEALRGPKRGALVGYGTSPEGVEQNEVVYELIADAGWRDREIDLQEYLAQYSTARYGQLPRTDAELLARNDAERLRQFHQ